MQTGGLLLFVVPSCPFPWPHATYNRPNSSYSHLLRPHLCLDPFHQLWAESALGKKAEETIDLTSQESTVFLPVI